jgi:membrane-associated HD superfamily phosphohydrolase
MPDYFVENQSAASSVMKTDPHMSAAIIVNHIKEASSLQNNTISDRSSTS